MSRKKTAEGLLTRSDEMELDDREPRPSTSGTSGTALEKKMSRKRTAEEGPLTRSNDDDEPLLTPVKRHRSGTEDRFLLSNLDAATIQLLMNLEGDSSEEELPEVPIIDIPGIPEEPEIQPLSPLAASLSPKPPAPSPPESSPTTPRQSPLPPQSLPLSQSPPLPSAPLSPERSASASPLPTNYSWSPDPPASRPSFEFSGDSNLLETPEGTSPGHFFDLMFTVGFFNLLVREINSFAAELMCRKVYEQQRRREKGLTPLKKPLIFKWEDVTIEEVKKWLGITFMMGIIKLDRLRDYWTQNEKFSLPFFHGHMSRDRWFSILEALHFAPNEASADPIFKIRPLVTYFHDRMAALINPARKVCIDESLAPWRGRISFRQYLPLKSNKYGIKLYMLTEPDGLIHRFLVYAGAGDVTVSGQGHTTKVIQKMMSGYLGVGRSLFQDNYYNSVDQARALLREKTTVTGTLRPNRVNNPPDSASRKLKRGESVQRWSPDGIYVTKLKDKRDVWTISTEFSGEMVSCEARRGFSRKPQSLVEYNKCMGGIDLLHQHLSYYTPPHRSIKLYKKFGLQIIELMLLNAYFLYRRFSVTSSKLNLYSFRLAIVDHLCGRIPTPTPSRVVQPAHDTIVEKHFPRLHPLPTEPGGRRKQLRCRNCYKRNVVKKATTYCGGCPDEPGLCLDQCFIEYHRELGVKILP
ncbi:hypothetical protein GE061_014680 [Apolygus lucorum]|uniref:PiggyBac transposable element-derived protein domain-containing protein n=1 Tax=Apolygus lucorum TaxID=248454 RepID=A0A8S9XL07_APOLU|nr:hypothetical protein GE061_014680 [Apolygus lucorum]